MSEAPQPDRKAVLKYTNLDTVTENDVYEKGVNLVAQKILPFVSDTPMIYEDMTMFEAWKDLPASYYGYKVLYSKEKDITCNVTINLTGEKASDEDLSGHELQALAKQGLGASRLNVKACFYKGKYAPSSRDSGTDYYFTGPTYSDNQKGELNLTVDTSGKTILSAYLGSEKSHDEDLAAINTMEVWLRDVEELR